jgi:copper chaperone CopZ
VTSAIYQVTGMTCQHCVHAVTGELMHMGGVSDVTVALIPGGLSAVTVTSEAPLTGQQVAAALDEAGDYRLADR